MGKRLDIDGFHLDNPSEYTKGVVVFTDGSELRVEDFNPMVSIIKGIFDTAGRLPDRDPVKKFYFGVLSEIQAANADRYQIPTDPYKRACYDYAINCGWEAGLHYSLGDLEKADQLSEAALKAAAVYLRKKGSTVFFDQKEQKEVSDIPVVKGKKTTLTTVEKFDHIAEFTPPDPSDIIETLEREGAKRG